MGILDRIGGRLKESARSALAPATDPRVTHRTSHQKQRALLDQVGEARKEVAAARQRLRATAEGVSSKLPTMRDQAREELRGGNLTMARLALQRRRVVMAELQTLERQLGEVEREEASLAMIEQRLSGQIEAFAARQEVIKARYSAAEAQVRINEAVTGVSQDFADLAAALRRAAEDTERMQARATAIDRLVQDGDLEAIGMSGAGEALDARTELSGADEDVEGELAALEKEL